MNNKEKALQIADDNKNYYSAVDGEAPLDSYEECEQSAMEMAEWKDQQFKDIIQKVRSDYMCLDTRSDSAVCALDSVLNILKKINND